MQQRRHRKIPLLGLALILFLSACASAPRSSSDPSRDIAIDEPLPAPPKDPATIPVELPPPVEEVSDSGLLLEGEFPEAEPILREVDRLDDPIGIEPIQPSVTTPVPPSAPGGVRGFRIQLLALSSRPEAEAAAREARQRLGIPVYLEFEPPHHKLRAGDFQDRGEALQWRDRARELGYEGAWVATTTIRPKAAGTP